MPPSTAAADTDIDTDADRPPCVMVVQEPGPLSSLLEEAPPRPNWAPLPAHCPQDPDLRADTSHTQRIHHFFMGQPGPRRSVRPCVAVARSCPDVLKPAEAVALKNDFIDDDSLEEKTSPDSLHEADCSTHVASTGMDKDVASGLTGRAEDRCTSPVADSEQDFPPIRLNDPQLRSAGLGAVTSPTCLTRTWAQVVSQDCAITGDATPRQECREGEETEHSHGPPEAAPELSPSGDRGGWTCQHSSSTGHVDKGDHRYGRHLDFAIKCGYSENDLDKVISRHGLDCDKNLLLQELINSSSGCGEVLDAPSDDLGRGGHSKTASSADNSTTEGQTVPNGDADDEDDDHNDDDVVIENGVKKDEQAKDADDNLRHIIIDGSNVAMSHGKNVFSCRGIQLVVDWFRTRGHRNITVFVPQWRKETPRPDTPITDQDMLLRLEQEGVVVFTPARSVRGRRVVCYDDRYVLSLAAHTQGVVVSNDNYRDLLKESSQFRHVVEERLLMYTFVNDRFMPPEDPLGRNGPTLDNFLRKSPRHGQTLQAECPYGRKCTFGTKCKYSHPERGGTPHRSVSEMLKEQASRRLQERNTRSQDPMENSASPRKSALTRTRSLVHGIGNNVEKSGLSRNLSNVQHQAPDPHGDNRSRSPPSSSGKTSDYLREHRKTLEKELARVSQAGSGCPSEVSAPWEPAGASHAGWGEVPIFPAQTSPGGPHPTSPVSGNEGHLVSGHLLLAKKLSDEVSSDPSFFSKEEFTRPERKAAGSPPFQVRTDRSPINHHSRRSSLPDSQHRQEVHHRVLPSPHHTHSVLKTCVTEAARRAVTALPSTFPYTHVTEPAVGPHTINVPPTQRHHLGSVQFAGQHSVFSAASSLAAQRMPVNSPPPDHLLACIPSGCSGDLDLHNGFSDPHVRTSGTSSTSFSPCCPLPCVPSPGRSSPGGRADHGDPSHHHHHHLHQPGPTTPDIFHHHHHPPPHPGPAGDGLLLHHSPTFPSFHYPPSSHLPPSSSPPPPHPPIVHPVADSGSLLPWQLSSPPPPVNPPPAHQPGCGTGGGAGGVGGGGSSPMAVTDPRYPLYLQLCGVFAQHRVQAVMNRYPQVTDPQTLCVCILSEL
ncbi:uncharacterized protein LOC143282983 [Babylonia areolata]|uniref:uncharacterized protein LOC143282983 n=1 Tax=Babylonia areolata TaxID=304850 RepID=UPI003FD619ED